MPHGPDTKTPYYAVGGTVYKHPIYTPTAGGQKIEIGFPVCVMHECVGVDAAELVANLMNLGHQTQDQKP